MAIFTNSFEGGTDGATITAGNSGGSSGSAFTSSNLPVGSTITYSVTSKFHDTMGCKVETTAGSLSPFLVADMVGTTRTVLRFYFRTSSVPTSTCTIAQLRSASASTLDIRFNASTGRLSIADTTGTNLAATQSGVLAANTWYRIEIAATPGTTSSNGSIEFACYAGDDTVAFHTASATNLNLGSASISRMRLGHPSSSTFIGVFDFDDIAVDNLASGFIGPSQTTPDPEEPVDPGDPGDPVSIGPAYGNTFEGGSNGTTITMGNSGGSSGYAFSGVSVAPDSTLIYSTASAFHGTLGMRIETTTVNASSFVQRDITAADRNALRFYFMMPALPSAVAVLAQFRSTSATLVHLSINSSGQLFIGNNAGTEIVSTRTTAGLQTNTWYRIEVAAAPGASTNTGTVDFAYFAGNSMTPIQSVTATGANFGGAQITRYRLGRPSPNTPIAVFHFDDVKALDLSHGFIGPEVVQANYEMVWNGSQWLESPESERVWNGSTWA